MSCKTQFISVGNPKILIRDGKPELAVITYQELKRQDFSYSIRLFLRSAVEKRKKKKHDTRPNILHILTVDDVKEVWEMLKNIFEQFGANVQVDEDDVMDMAADAAQTDLADDTDVRNLIRSVGAMVGKEIDPEIEDRLTAIITSGEAPTDMASLMEMMS